MTPSSEPPEVSVIILNYNTAEMTGNCVRSVLEKTAGVSFEVVVVDNGSRDVERLRGLPDEDPRVRLVESAENKGFAGGNNVGILASTGESILLLNSDTVLVNDAISLALDEVRSGADVGVVSAKLMFPDGSPQAVCRRFPSILRELAEAFRLHRLVPKERRVRWLQGGYFDHKSRLETDAIWGAFFLFPRRVLAAFPGGRLSETFFMYGEDMEWCWLIRQHGYRVIYQPAAQVIHYIGGSGFESGGDGPRTTIYRHRIQFLVRYRGFAFALLFAVARYVNILLSRRVDRALELNRAQEMFRALRRVT